MNPLQSIVRAFIDTFGITRPAPGQEVRAGRFIALLLAAVILFLSVVAWLLRAAFTR